MREMPDCLNRRYKVLNDLIEDIISAMPASMDGPGGSCPGCGGPGGGGRGGGGPGSSCPGCGGHGGGGRGGGGPGSSCPGCGGHGGGGRGGGGPGSSCPGCGGSSGGGRDGGGPGSPCSSLSSHPPVCAEPKAEDTEVGIRLMCDFWKILQDDPDSNLTQAVQRLCTETCTDKCSSASMEKKVCSKSSITSGAGGGSGGGKRPCGCDIKHSSTKIPKKHDCGASSATMRKDVPLRKVLGNLKQAASFEKKCNDRLSELLSAQKDLTEQISNLEEREKKGVLLMKQADHMWTCMEDSYKQKLAASEERYQNLQKQLKEVEASTTKWRKNKKDLEFQMENINKCSQDINEKKIQKENDVKVMELEIEGFKKRIASNEKDLTAAKNSYTSKKNASDAQLEKIAKEMEKIQSKIRNECKCKADKENEGIDQVKEARDELQKLCRALLQKKIENEDLRAEKEALVQEIGLLKSTYDTCSVRCEKRETNIADETKRIDKEISRFTAKCVKCHVYTDSSDLMRCCIDCPKCLIQRECLNEGDHCSTDHSRDCVCTRVKQKFLDNVFENMYTVLERQVKTCPGKEMADGIFHCLKRSKNGKLDEPTRKILQEFVLSTVKKNLNLTIVGGAVKTRCEMDPDTYRQLMLCLKDVAVTRPVKEDKGTPAKKPPCSHWHSSTECNCPQGPKGCPCTKKAPKPPTYPGSCGQSDTEEVVDSSVKICPKAEPVACGVDCGMLGLPGAAEKRKPCDVRTCPFGPNMRAAQCVLGPEALADVRAARPTPAPARRTPPIVPPDNATCISGRKAVKSSDTRHLKGDVMENFKEGTMANYQKTTNENLKLKMSLSDAASTQASVKPTSSLQKAILFTDEQQEKIFEEFTKNNLNQNETKKQFQIVFKNKHGQSDREFTELTQTPSGNLAIELDEQTIKIIEEKTMIGAYLYMSIETSSSGHVLVEFDTKQNVIDKTHRVTFRQTSSGTKLLDVHKNMIRTLKNTLSNKIPNASSSKSIKLPSSPTRSESPIDTDTELPRLTMNDKDVFVRIGNNDPNTNATLIKTLSERVLLIPQSFQAKHQNGHAVDDFYKVKFSVMRNQELQLPAVLKPTPSKNYLVVLDKEFERCYEETLREYFGDNLEGSVDLHTTNSGNYILALDNEDESNFGKKNAILVKTSSGHIKVLVHGPEFESLVQQKLSISSTSSAQASAQMDSNLPASSREFHRENLRKSKNLDNQASSETKLLRKVKGNLQDSLPLVSEPSTVLKKTPSGQYAILLNEESKKSLLNNLQSNSLTSNTEGLVPIKRLDSGEVIINLSNKDEGKSHYGTLKVTPSGNFYVIFDEKVMKDLTESSTKNEVSCSVVGTMSKHAMQLIDSIHKSVATTCQAKPDHCCCDPSTFVCTNGLFETKDGSNDKLAQLCPCVLKEASAGGVSIASIVGDESDLTVFEYSFDSNQRKNSSESTQQCLYWLEASYPHHRSDSLSSKLLGKSEFIQPHEYQPEKKNKFEANCGEPAGQNAAQVWNSLDYLPPQLPYFLKDVRFR